MARNRGTRETGAAADAEWRAAAAAGERPALLAAGRPRLLNARPDGLDFRDRVFEPTLIEVPHQRELARHLELGVAVRDQGEEGACTGFGLAAVADALLRGLHAAPEDARVSAHMLYDMARRYDEWAGVDYDGSSCRGAMKGWHKHGVCSDGLWERSAPGRIGALSAERAADAALRPLGAYSRVNHRDLVALHCALAEVGVLYASAQVHSGWDRVRGNGLIPREGEPQGGHAFAVVGYDAEGFWIQNSWGEGWGKRGHGRIAYDDWLAHATDAWVARLGVPVRMSAGGRSRGSAEAGAVRGREYSRAELRPHVVTLGNDGELDERGELGTSAEAVRAILQQDFPRITADWPRKRLVLYAHGGLVSRDEALQRVAEYRKPLLDAHCYPLAFVWKTDYLTTLKNMLGDALARRRTEGALRGALDFMLDRLDDALEPLARVLTGKAAWDELKENARRATTRLRGGARFAAERVAELARAERGLELHVVGHSAGAVLLAPLLQYLTGEGEVHFEGGPAGDAAVGLELPVASCALWAPACTTALFKDAYAPALESGALERFALFALGDTAERADDCGGIYHKSLLYLVSNAFEARARNPLRSDRSGEPLLGLEHCVRADPALEQLFKGARAARVIAPNQEPLGSPNASRAAHHADFDDDPTTVQATLARILGADSLTGPLAFERSASARRERRRWLDDSSLPAPPRGARRPGD